MPKFRALAVIGAGVLLSIAAVACSGDDSPSAAAGAAGGSGQSINLSQSAAKLSELKSFRFNAKASIDYEGTVPSTADEAFGMAMLDMFMGSLKDIELQGAVVAPDQFEIKADLSGQQLGFVQIKDKAWAQYFGGWTAIEPEDLGLEDSIDFGDFAADALPPEVLQAAKTSKEKVNGVDTTRYHAEDDEKTPIEGVYTPGQKAIIMDDLVTGGGSIIETAERLREAGLLVKDAFVLVDRQQGARERLKADGINLRSALTLEVLVNYLKSSGRIENTWYRRTMDYLDATRKT